MGDKSESLSRFFFLLCRCSLLCGYRIFPPARELLLSLSLAHSRFSLGSHLLTGALLAPAPAPERAAANNVARPRKLGETSGEVHKRWVVAFFFISLFMRREALSGFIRSRGSRGWMNEMMGFGDWST